MLPVYGRATVRTKRTETDRVDLDYDGEALVDAAAGVSVPVLEIAEEAVIDLPEPVVGVMFVVNSVVAQYVARRGRTDCVIPGKRELIDGEPYVTTLLRLTV